ncbi:ATP synthase F0 subcomplex B subunit [Abditibacterium utsteinense]|uniref:ATP synthase subunit b n=1 Tax=Abditibacterium utsteinense TaxID=1960156 RepID=A0A2S8SV97_9BACT|nr:F0F1 ATP synthase subunit B [Abditibacterium utsteinense]PQV64712.1 ATP synthase F0 subcomplex B subunit [Abditibacterium utsteinense]
MGSILETLGINPRFILISLVGFLILLFVLSKYAFGPLVRTLQARQDKIRGDLDDAQKSRDDMVALQRDYEQRLAAIEDEARDKIQAAVKEAQLARDQILAKAHDDAQVIVQRGQEEAIAERAKLLVDSRNQIVDLATLMARQSARENLSVAGQANLIDDAIAKIGSLN